MSEKNKIFVLDTNVIMNDAECILRFGEGNHVIIPLTVLMELDKHKSGNRPINFQVRLFHKMLDSMSSTQDSSQKLFNGGVDLFPASDKKKGKISVKSFDLHSNLVDKLDPEKNDYKIINVAYSLRDEYPDSNIILISEDLNVRLTARALDVTTQASKFNSASDESLSYSGLTELKDDSLISLLYQEKKKDKINIPGFEKKIGSTMNEYFFVENDLFRYVGNDTLNSCVPFGKRFGIKAKNLGQRALMDALMDNSIRVVTGCGPAGTGKTLLGLVSALQQQDGPEGFDSILVSRREIGADDEGQGFLPGDSKAKSAPYMMPFIDNIKVIKANLNENELKKFEKKLSNRSVELNDSNPMPFEILSLAYIRGRTITSSFVIIDEAQNLTPALAKAILTRAGERTKFLFCGDIDQVDDPFLRKNLNGLSYLIENLRGSGLYAHVTLDEVERSELAKLATSLPSLT